LSDPRDELLDQVCRDLIQSWWGRVRHWQAYKVSSQSCEEQRSAREEVMGILIK
jgi:hypothetical protein